MNKAKKPEIRFKDFSDKWKEYKLGEVTTSYSGGTPAVGITEYYNGQIPFIRSAEVNRNYTELFITQKGLDNSSAKLVSKGDILYALYGATSGEVGRARLNGAINQAILAIKPLIGYDPEYLTQWLRKSKRNIIETYLQGGQGNLSGAIVKKLAIDFPSYEEQQVIGIYLQKFDEVIMRLQSKLEKLQAVKTSMLVKMFPKDGADVPEVRFKGFTGAWKKYSFKNITYPSGMKNKDNIPYESYSITNESGFVPQNEKFENGGTMKNADKRMYIIVEPHSFAYNPARINVGLIGYQYLDYNVIVSSLYEVFKTTDECDDQFLWYWFKTKAFDKMIEQLQEGGVRLYFYYDKLCMCSLKMPDLEEQSKIAEYFKNLDDLISACSKELDKLQSIKKALLEKMFV